MFSAKIIVHQEPGEALYIPPCWAHHVEASPASQQEASEENKVGSKKKVSGMMKEELDAPKQQLLLRDK